MSDAAAVFAEPLAAACRIVEQGLVPPGANAAVLGDGKLGLLVAEVLARRAGAAVAGTKCQPRALATHASRAPGCRFFLGFISRARWRMCFGVVCSSTTLVDRFSLARFFGCGCLVFIVAGIYPSPSLQQQRRRQPRRHLALLGPAARARTLRASGWMQLRERLGPRP